jgi:hypothetical protein
VPITGTLFVIASTKVFCVFDNLLTLQRNLTP